MNEVKLRNLIDRYLTGSLTEPERLELSSLLSQPGYQEALKELLAEEFRSGKFEDEGHEQVLSQIEKNVTGKISFNKRKRWISVRSWAAAAAILVLVFGSYYFFFRGTGSEPHRKIEIAENKILPGGNRAKLTLSDGSAIVLDSVSNGEVAKQGNSKIVKSEDGKIIYHSTGSAGGEVALNTLSTPIGGVYQITLPDGTRVWLNASSSITYPAEFRGTQRNVQITGEAYFEVAKDKSRLFRVIVNDLQVEVLGTHFNINSYENETDVKTTLLEGSIRLRAVNTSTILSPGDQAQIGKDGKVNILKEDDLEQVISWKTGYFNFRNADLPAVMRQLERWYDIQVKYEGGIPRRRFQGELPRNYDLSGILKVFDEMKISYTLNGKTLTITQ